jgi:hypothetical protein
MRGMLTAGNIAAATLILTSEPTGTWDVQAEARSAPPVSSAMAVSLLADTPEIADPLSPLPEPGKKLGHFRFTYYWVAAQGGQQAEPATRVLRDRHCKPIATVSKNFAAKVELEGTGLLDDGRTLNAAGRCRCGRPCYKVAAPEVRWGLGILNRPLSPFRSVAVDRRRVQVGRWLYVEELDGVTMPGSAPWGGFVHDGCVLADDIGGRVRGRQLDFFAGRRDFYRLVAGQRRIGRVTVHDGTARCTAAQAARLLGFAVDLSRESIAAAASAAVSAASAAAKTLVARR